VRAVPRMRAPPPQRHLQDHPKASRVLTKSSSSFVIKSVYIQTTSPPQHSRNRNMDRLKGVAKGGWHPPGDPHISRKTWKSDIKGMATGKRKDPYEDARNHQSAPLTSLKDPDSFGAPPKHTGAYGSNPASPSSPVKPPARGGWGSSVPAPSARQQQQAVEEEASKPAPGPYRTDTTGLRTDNLPAPPRRGHGPAPATPPRTNSGFAAPPPAVPARQPQPQHGTAPAPSLPPRMNDHPDEYTPPPPPTYNEATQPNQQDPAALNTGAVNRLGQAGVSVPAFGIGSNSAPAPPQSPTVPAGHSGQLSELQQRFARMNAGSQNEASASVTPSTSSPAVAAAAHKKPPPPPPPKKAGLSDSRPASSDAASAPPPLALSSKPRPS
jgi:hypothetical protein